MSNNFDTLRAANLGALAYICRPKVKPKELLALFTLNGSTENFADTAYSVTAGSYQTGPFTNSNGGKTVSGVFALGSTWSADFYMTWGATATNIAFFGAIKLGTGTQDGKPRLIWDSSTNVATNLTQGAWYHVGVTCDGTTTRVYFNGQLKTTSIATAANLTIASGQCAMSNFRVVGKCLTTDSTFPIPTNFYTGYEAL